MSLNPKEIGPALVALREAAVIKQSEMKDRLGIHQSTLSRLEAGDLAGDRDLYLRYLKCLNIEAAAWAADALDMDWKHVEKPQLNHPDLRHLIIAERSLARLDAFRALPNLPSTLHGQAEMLRTEAWTSAKYLRSLRHSVAYVGGINVG